MAVPAITAYVKSSEFSSTFAASKAFDRTVTAWIAATSTGYVGAQYASGFVARAYYVTHNLNEPTRAPQAWTFEGSNDGSSWTTLDTRTSQTSWVNPWQTRYFTFSNSTSYTYYRLNVTTNNGDSLLAVAELYVSDAVAVAASGSYPDAVLADSPALYVRFSETSGSVAEDVSGNHCSPAGLSGTYTRGTTGLLADSDKAVTLATNGWGRVNTWPQGSTFSGALTVEAVIKLSSLPTYSVIAQADNEGDSRNWIFRVDSNGSLAFVWWTSTAAGPNFLNSSASAIATGTTYHVAVTHTGSTATLYINGASVASSSVANGVRFQAIDHLALGATYNGGGFFLNGVLDEVAVYPTALSSTRIAAHSAAVTASSSLTGTIAGTSPSGAGALTGTVATTGTIAGTSPAGVGALTGTAPTTGTVAGVSPSGVGAFSGTSDNSVIGTIAGTSPVGSGALAGTVATTGTLAGVSPAGVGSLVGAVTTPPGTDTVAGTSPSGQGSISGTSGDPLAPRPTICLTHRPVGVLPIVPLVPSTELAEAEPVLRVSHQMPRLSASHPSYTARVDYPVVKGVVGHVHLWINGQDVTYFRDVPTVIRRWESEAPFGDTVASFEFPQLNPWDKPGEGDLSFLKRDAKVAIGIVEEFPGDGFTVTRTRRLWSGFLDARGNGTAGEREDYAWEAKGTLWQAQHRNREPYPYTEPMDIGVLVARVLNAVEGRRWRTMPLTPIGIKTLTRGSRDDTAMEFVQAVLSEAITDDGNQWSLSEVSPGILRLVLKPAPTTVHATVAYGTPGVDIDLRVDESTRIDRIFARGIGAQGAGWANVFFPGLELLAAPAYPNTDLSNIGAGDTDADTDSGTGVTDWQRRVSEIRGFGNPPVSGVMSSAWVAVIDDLQRTLHITADGSLGPQTWNATFDRAVGGVDLTPRRLPVASKPTANKWLYSATGVRIGPNPNFDSTLIVRDIGLDLGPGKTKAQGRKLARTLLAKYGNAAASGTIVWTFDPNETDRTRLSHLSNIKVTGHESTDRVLQVASKSVELESGDSGPVYVVTTQVDEHARDAMYVEDLLNQRREAKADLSRRPGPSGKASRQVADQRTPWDSESPCGVLRRTAVNGSSGLWTVVTIPFAEVGKLAGIRLKSTRPFAFAIFASLRITENKLASIVGNPFAKDDPWRDEKGLLDGYGIIEAWGQKDQACGYSPKTEGDPGASFTGEFVLDSPVDYWTETPPYVSVAIYMRGGSGWISGNFLPAYES